MIVTHNMQQAARASDRTAFFTAEVDDQGKRVGRLVEYDVTEKLFTAPPTPAPRVTSPGGSVELMSPQRRDSANATLEQALAAALRETETATVQHDRFRAVLDELRQAVLVLDADGVEVFRNPAAERYRAARHSDAVVAGALDSLISRALLGEACERELQLFGPPRAVVRLSAMPIGDAERTFGSGRARRRRLRGAPHRERAPRLRGQREPRAQDADRRTGGAGRDPRRGGRSSGDASSRRTHRQGSGSASPASSTTSSTSSLIETQEAPRRTPVPLEVLVDDAVEQLRPTAVAAGINLQLHPGVTGALVACDDRQVVSAIREPHRQCGEVLGARQSRHRSTALVGDLVEVAVRDAGIGIPAGISSASSSGSIAWTRRGVAPPAVPGWGSPSCATSLVRMAVTSPSSPSRGRA